MKSLRNLSARCLLPGLALVLAQVSAAPPCLAAEADASETAAARSLAIDGMKLAQAGKCEEAIEKLKRAEDLHHSAIVLGRLGECYVAVGRLVEGTEALRRMLREPLPENPTPAQTQAYERAQSVLDASKPRIGALNIGLEVPAGVEPKITVDGKEISAAVIGADLPADPGRHTVTVSARGYLTTSQEVSLDAGAKQSVSLKLVKDPYAKEIDPPVPAAAEKGLQANGTGQAPHLTPVPPPVAEEGSHVPAYVSWIVGAAGLGVGIGFGVSALNAKNDLQQKCPNQECDPAYKNDLDGARLKGNIATVGFGVGALGVVLGTIFYAAAGSDAPEKTATGTSKDSLRDHRARAWLTPGGVFVGADF